MLWECCLWAGTRTGSALLLGSEGFTGPVHRVGRNSRDAAAWGWCSELLAGSDQRAQPQKLQRVEDPAPNPETAIS